MYRSLGALGVLLALVCPGLASAQAYPFESIARGSGGGTNDAPLQQLIDSEQQLQATGADRLLPPGTTIDFGRDALIVVRMGSRPTGGYGIEIRDIQATPNPGSTPGGPAVSLHTVINVKVFSRSPGPGEMVTMAFTSPYHVVKVARPPVGRLIAQFQDMSASVDFDSFRRSQGSFVHASSIEVKSSGEVEIHERRPGSMDTTNASGQVGPAQIEQLKRALAQVDFATLPRDLGDDPNLMDAPGVSYVLSNNGTDTTSSGMLPVIPQVLRQRLAPLDRVLDVIRDQVLQSVPDDEFKGEVVVQGGEVKLRGPQETLTLRGDLARTVRRFRGQTVKVAGQVAPGEVQVTAILYPERKTVTGSVDLSGFRARLLTGNASARLVGRARRAVRRAGAAALVTVDGWVFSDLNTNTIEAVYLESVQAKVERSSILTLSGAFQGFVRTGDAVEVLALSRTGRYARVKSGDVEGYMRVTRLQIGEPVVAMATPGLSGSLPQ